MNVIALINFQPSLGYRYLREMKRALLPILLIVLLDVFGYTILIPLLPFYAEHFGATPAIVGLLVTFYAVCQLFSGPVLGHLSDRYGRKPLLLISQCGTLLSFVGLAFSRSLLWIFVARGIDGFTSGNVTIAQAWLADNTAPEERAKVFGLTGAIFGAGFLVGPAVSAVLFTYGYRVPMLAAAAFSGASILCTLVLLPNARASSERREPLRWRDLVPFTRVKELFADSELRVPAVQFAFFALSFSLYFVGVPLFAERRYTVFGHAFGPRETAMLFVYSASLSLVVQTWGIGPWVKRYGERKLVDIGFTLSAAGYALLMGRAGVAALFAAATLFAVGNAVTRPALMAIVSRGSKRSQHGGRMGALQSFYSMADITGPALGGWLISRGWLTGWAGLISGLAVLGFSTDVLLNRIRRVTKAAGASQVAT